MELHRNTGKVRRTNLLIAAFGALCVSLPALLGLLGREFFLGPWFWYIAGGVAVAVGVYGIYSSLRPFRVELQEAGLVLRVGGLNSTVPWGSVAAITIERLSYLKPPALPHVILWPAEGVDLGAKPTYKKDGRAGYELAQLDDLVETPDEVVAILQRYAGAKFSASDLPTSPR